MSLIKELKNNQLFEIWEYHLKKEMKEIILNKTFKAERGEAE